MNKEDITTIACNLLTIHKLYNWKFSFNTAKRQLGLCDYKEKTISVSENIVTVPMKTVKNVILHEIAHALAGHGNGHNYTWKRKAISIGCDGRRTSSVSMKSHHKWIWSCTNKLCVRYYEKIKAHRKYKTHVCGECRSKIKWKLNHPTTGL